MSFVKKQVNTTPIEDTVFAIVAKAAQAKETHGKDQVVDATIGSLYDESGKLVALDTVFKSYDAIPKEQKAKY
ncbi:MAG: aspartate/aromatic aminotransferase, partial [Erysipelotrichaceae bacterium]|nr:aspartate/aromatic aminotransferase [Erysipelotrichaceae bacterium]